MSVSFVRGDIFLTSSHAAAVDLNAAGRLATTPFYTALHDRYPVFVSEYHKQGRAGQLTPGRMWVWPDSRPWLVGLIVRETPQGAARLRFVETALLNLVRDWERAGLRSLALMRLGDEQDWPIIRGLVMDALAPLALPVTVYEAYVPGLVETPDQPPDLSQG